MDFSKDDIKQLETKGLTQSQVTQQIELFKTGLPYVNLHNAATVGNGILKLPKTEQDYYTNYFNQKRNSISLVKFVPASGAATRMFKFLFNFLKDFNPEKESINAYINRKKDKSLSIFYVGIKDFPFYHKVKKQLYKDYPDFNTLSKDKQLFLFVKTMLDETKLNYGNFPKGLLPFHQYKKHTATAFEEHLYEAAFYASNNQSANLHFTISENHEDKFKGEFDAIKTTVEQHTNVNYNISYSFQKQSTDTIAVTLNNEPFRNNDGNLVFRPSGHGALLNNLNQIDADIIFIKNIDNVVVNKFSNKVGNYKMMLAGVLLKLQEQIFKYQTLLDQENLTEESIHEAANFISKKLNVVINNDFEKYSLKYKIEYLQKKLNRPIRVCGMVKNEGEPGGGPFWVKNEDGSISLQIVESAQVDKKNKHQKELLKTATHFNPVDLICGIKNYQGKKYDLSNFVDLKTAFITQKTAQGKDIKALELPGLWNGSMAFWNTIFVEVPLITFNPVKTVNDLLKHTHQTI